MTTINQVGLPLSGSTGTGTFVGANTPTLITPVLGAATATSINFGGSTLSNYVNEGSWTPVFTFATVGDLSVTYATQFGSYTRIGSVVYYVVLLSCTPTFTTSSGGCSITGLPLTCFGANVPGNAMSNTAGVTYTSGRTVAFLIANASSTTLSVICCGSAVSQSQMTPSNFVSGAAITLSSSGFYFV